MIGAAISLAAGAPWFRTISGTGSHMQALGTGILPCEEQHFLRGVSVAFQAARYDENWHPPWWTQYAFT
ncbi:hypothetical protein [Mesorhizobium huakuii]|uniref:Uncharacterized protein n=1 Tax=Mesorhizobium huakuii TaxID=28104 RepID=A0ABZ0VMK8_9HYPH|nr:hypothetical protein [Mesorhizobium huakuii]WQB98687.1 hypothetical protein U0R22_002851 [Mesorhizobium huakuii]